MKRDLFTLERRNEVADHFPQNDRGLFSCRSLKHFVFRKKFLSVHKQNAGETYKKRDLSCRSLVRKSDLYLMVLLRKMICNLGDPMSLRHPVP